MGTFSHAQTKIISSLENKLAVAKTSSEKQAAIFMLCEQGSNMHPDTLLSYAKKAKLVAINEHNLHDEVRSMYYECMAYTTKGLIDSSLKIAGECSTILSGKVDDADLLANIYNQMGRCFMRKNQYKEAIEMGYKTIVGAEKTKNTLLEIKGKTLIGWAHLEMGQTNEALSWHLKALHTTSDSVLLEKYGILFANLALNYVNLGKKDSAFYYADKAIAVSRKHENLFALSNSLAIKSQLYIRVGTPAPAEALLEEVVAIRKLIGDPFYIVSDMSQLGLYYAHYGMPEKGITICNEGIALAKQYKMDSKLLFLYGSLGENYKASGDKIKYGEVLEKIITLKDSVFQKNSEQSLAEIQTKYELQKKENLIILQKLEITRQHYFLYGLLMLAVFSVVAAWLLFRAYKKRQQIKIKQMQEEEKQQSVLAVLKAGETERKRIAADLHDNLGAYAASIASNLDHISLNKKDDADSVVLQELRNNSQAIVSQLIDTIWVLKKDNLSLTAISDRIKIFIKRIQPGYPNVTMDVIENISSDIIMLAPKAFHLYQVVQEGLINAVKHSAAQHIRVYVESGNQWKITISDDGKGMAATGSFNADGHGLLTMQNRCKEAGFNISWSQNETKGTNVVIRSTTN
ncbi:MAG: ATP-binding protein [Ferruginibacter sp.]